MAEPSPGSSPSTDAGPRPDRRSASRAIAGGSGVAFGALYLALLGVLGVLVILPLGLIVLTSFLSGLPFSGNTGVGLTLGNYRTLAAADIGQALANTLVVSLGGAGMAMVWPVIITSTS